MKKHTKFSILHFALAAGVSLLIVLAAPAGADFFTQVIDASQQQCPVGQMFCGTLQQCTTTPQCNSSDTLMGVPTSTPMQPFNNQSTAGSCSLPNILCGPLNFQCVTGQECEAASGAGPANSQSSTPTQTWSQQASGGCPSGQFKCVTLGGQCATFADCDAADKAKMIQYTPTQPGFIPSTTIQTTTTPTTNQNKNTGSSSAPTSVSTDNPFDVSTFGDKEINIPKLPSSVNLTNTKTLNTLIKKTIGTKSDDEAMGKILSITQALSNMCDITNLKCPGRDKFSVLIEEAAFDGLDSKNMKKIKKAFENFAKAVNKEYAKSQKSSKSSAKKKK